MSLVVPSAYRHDTVLLAVSHGACMLEIEEQHVPVIWRQAEANRGLRRHIRATTPASEREDPAEGHCEEQYASNTGREELHEYGKKQHGIVDLTGGRCRRVSPFTQVVGLVLRPLWTNSKFAAISGWELPWETYKGNNSRRVSDDDGAGSRRYSILWFECRQRVSVAAVPRRISKSLNPRRSALCFYYMPTY